MDIGVDDDGEKKERETKQGSNLIAIRLFFCFFFLFFLCFFFPHPTSETLSLQHQLDPLHNHLLSTYQLKSQCSQPSNYSHGTDHSD